MPRIHSRLLQPTLMAMDATLDESGLQAAVGEERHLEGQS